MANNYAIVIGINEYSRGFNSLEYAKNDAEKMQDFFTHIAKFDRVHLFSDDSPEIELSNGTLMSSSPSFTNLINYLKKLSSNLGLNKDDNLWFFFAGHGFRYCEKNYLVPIDATLGESRTGIEVDYIRERLVSSVSGNVILVLDACRNEPTGY